MAITWVQQFILSKLAIDLATELVAYFMLQMDLKIRYFIVKEHQMDSTIQLVALRMGFIVQPHYLAVPMAIVTTSY